MMSDKPKDHTPRRSQRLKDKDKKRSDTLSDKESEKLEKKRKLQYDELAQNTDELYKTDLQDDIGDATRIKRAKDEVIRPPAPDIFLRQNKQDKVNVDQEFFDSSQRSKNNNSIIRQSVLNNKEILIKNFEAELIKSSIDIDVRDFYKNIDHETTKIFKKDFFIFITTAIKKFFVNKPEYFLNESSCPINFIHFFKLVFVSRVDKINAKFSVITEITEDMSTVNEEYIATSTNDTKSQGAIHSKFIELFKEMVPKPSDEFDDEDLARKFRYCEEELIQKLEQLRLKDPSTLFEDLDNILTKITENVIDEIDLVVHDDDDTQTNSTSSGSKNIDEEIKSHEKNQKAQDKKLKEHKEHMKYMKHKRETKIQNTFDKSITPFKLLCNLVYDPKLFNCYQNEKITFVLPEDLEEKFPHLKDVKNVIETDLTFKIHNTSGNTTKAAKYPLEIKLPSIATLLNELGSHDISSRSRGIYKQVINQMVAFKTNVCFLSDHNNMVILLFQENGENGITESKLKNSNDLMVEIPFRILTIDNTYQNILKYTGDLDIKDKLTFEMLMLIMMRHPFEALGDSKKLLDFVLLDPRKIQEQRIRFMKSIISYFNDEDFLSNDDFSDTPTIVSSQIRPSSSSSSNNTLIPTPNKDLKQDLKQDLNKDLKFFNCPMILKHVKDILSETITGQESKPSVSLLLHSSELEKLNIMCIDQKSKNELVVLKIFDVEYAHINYHKSWIKYQYADFKEFYRENIYKDAFLKELKVMRRIKSYNDSVFEDKKINTSSLLGFGILTSFVYNGPFIIHSYIDCIIRQKPKTKEHLELGIQQFNRLLGIGINHNDIAKRNIGFDEEEKKFYIIDFDHSEMLPEGKKYNYSMTYEMLKCELGL
ncbi:hypothetical protein BN7_1658 [Wickerhamomyces ciferrii]|uniref:Protein kinase domain-containing protein n=1 Tax=Wickerhamomyces ciferrii (strain ATCC 14091 / BCRC 22168 / CBS 111 / JCM 3599 / NBRC 0793 / NRRL Y-1031 F-60-10) TaxID=1206466 RepID=K0KAT8_WICCF|nr:uncharacterized protein BN7_1658 [Wickerhamomyces ciferrii]CCH42115.1 hypothetical protein BN7_1658 [Wickerhamomyces ciferrii]